MLKNSKQWLADANFECRYTNEAQVYHWSTSDLSQKEPKETQWSQSHEPKSKPGEKGGF